MATTNWKLKALCQDAEDPDLWFPTYDTPVTEIHRAKEICQRCPVKDVCYQHKEKYGIWGGVLIKLDRKE